MAITPVLIGEETSLLLKTSKIRLASNCRCPGGEPCVPALSPPRASPHIRPQTHTESSTQPEHDQHQQRPSTNRYNIQCIYNDYGDGQSVYNNNENGDKGQRPRM